MDLKKSSVIITGAASGFGEFLADYLDGKAQRLFLIDINGEALSKFSGMEKTECFTCDLRDYDLTTSTISEIYNEDPQASILINNAGLIHSELLINLFNRTDHRHSKENWDKMLDINLSTVFNCSVNVIDNMIKNRVKGLIINISSISAGGNSGQSVYSASKAGVNALTVAWSRELGMFGIRTVGVAPGFFDTPSTHKALKENVVNKIINEIPLKRLGKPEELAKAICFIIDNDYFNGKVLELDGGMVLS